MDPLTPLTPSRVHARSQSRDGDRPEVRRPPRRTVPGAQRRRGSTADAAQHLGAARRRHARRAQRHRHASRRPARGPQVDPVRQPGPADQPAQRQLAAHGRSGASRPTAATSRFTPLDPRPLGSSEFGGNFVLRRFSDETGGRAIFNTNDHAEYLDTVFNDASAYYLVGYTPTRESADGKFHKIDVEVKRRACGSSRAAATGRRARRAQRADRRAARAGGNDCAHELVEPRTGRTAEIWVGFARGDEARTNVAVTWEPTARVGNTAATRIDVER